MEKPTGVIQKIIESLQQINALDTYSPIEKDIILHNLRAAYMIFLNIPTKEGSTENRVEQLFVQEKGEKEKAESGKQNEEEVYVGAENLLPVENIETENLSSSEEMIEEEVIEEKEEVGQQLEILDEELLEEQLEKGLQEVTEVPEVAEEVEIIEEPVEEIIEGIEEVEEIEQDIEEQVEEQPQEVIDVIKVPEVFKVSEEEIVVVEESAHTQPLIALHDDILEFIPDAQPTLLSDETTIPKPEKKSLNDLLTEKKDDNSLGTKFQQSHIPDLTKAIAINEKFSFIRELFHNSGVDFSNAIQKLNECENIDVAFNLMEELKHQYLWDTTSSTYLSLCDLVRRRFL